MGRAQGWTRESYDNHLRRLRQRRLDFLADKVCETCGGPDRLEARWRTAPGPIRASAIWQVSAQRREEYCKLLRVQCAGCRNKETGAKSRVGHGEGTQGTSGCTCGPCRAARSKYVTQWRRDKRARAKALAQLSERPHGTVGQ